MATSHGPHTGRRGDQIEAHPDVLRGVAAELRGVAEQIDAVLPDLKDLHDTTTHEASANTDDGGPAPYFSPLLDALRTANGKVLTNVQQARENVLRDAEALAGLADAIEDKERTNAAKISNL